jgi:hypothetical protein
MQSSRLQRYLHSKRHGKDSRTIKKNEIPQNPDPHIDLDFPGYPHNPGSHELINPTTANEKKTAAIVTKDGEKRNDLRRKNGTRTDQNSVGSGGAFEATENMQDED